MTGISRKPSGATIRSIMLRGRSAAVALVLLAVGCGAAPSGEVASPVGTREWVSPFGSGHLHLREDSTFCLSLEGAPIGVPRELRGDWRGDPPDGVVLVVRDRSLPQPSDGDAGALAFFAPGTEIMVLLARGAATYLGVDGVVDLNWGF